MRLFSILIFCTVTYSFSGDTVEVEVSLNADSGTLDIANQLSEEIIDMNLCGETPGICNASTTDIDLIINATVHDIYISVFNITLILLACVIIQLFTVGILIKVAYFTKKKIQYQAGRRNRIVQQNIFDPLTAGV